MPGHWRRIENSGVGWKNIVMVGEVRAVLGGGVAYIQLGARKPEPGNRAEGSGAVAKVSVSNESHLDCFSWGVSREVRDNVIPLSGSNPEERKILYRFKVQPI